MIKGGLAWLLRQGGVVGDVVDHRGINIVGSTEEKRGGGTVNTTGKPRHVLTRYEGILGKGGNIRENIPGVSCFWAEEPEGESCGFDRLGVCGGRTDCVSGFVSSF